MILKGFIHCVEIPSRDFFLMISRVCGEFLKDLRIHRGPALFHPARLNLAFQEVKMTFRTILFLTFTLSLLLGQNLTVTNDWTRYIGSELNDDSRIIRDWGDDHFFVLCREWGWNPDYYHNIKAMKIDGAGNEQWSRTVETSTIPDVYNYMDAVVLDDNDVIITGQLELQLWVSKIDSGGNVLWSNTYFEPDYSNYGCDVCITPNNEILIAGFHSDSVLLMNLSQDGQTNWCTTYPHDDYFTGVGISVEFLPNNKIVIGANLSFAESDDVIAEKACFYILNNDGVLDSISVIELLDWYSGHNLLIDMEYKNDHLYILGSPGFLSFDESHDYYIACFDTSYKKQWVHFYGQSRLEPNNLFIDQSNNLLICGLDGDRNAIVTKCDSLGNILWEYTFYDGAAKYLFSMTECGINQYMVAGFISIYQELSSQIFIQKLSDRPNDIFENNNSILRDYSVMNYPNPFNASTIIHYSIPKCSRINLTLLDIHGRIVRTLIDDIQYPGEYSEILDASQLCSGLYFARLRSGDFTVSRKMVLIK